MKIAALMVVACWPIYLSLFVRKPTKPKAEANRDALSLIGVFLQFSAVVLVWVWRRPLFSSIAVDPLVNGIVMSSAAVGAVASVLVSRWALQSLGENWDFVASVGRDHQLVESGPYAVLRHPLYLCFFVLTLATAVVWSQPLAIAIGGVVFVAGVWIRVRVEEKLLRAAFGERFEAYRRKRV